MTLTTDRAVEVHQPLDQARLHTLTAHERPGEPVEHERPKELVDGERQP